MKIFKSLAVLALAAIILSACLALQPAPTSTPTSLPPTPTTPPTPTSLPTSLPPIPPAPTVVPTTPATPVEATGSYPPAVVAAVQTLAKRLNIPQSEIKVSGFEAVDWPDACLGVIVPGEACAQVVTPGYKVLLVVGTTRYEFHTNAKGTAVRQAGGPAPAGLALSFSRTGGIAGFCDTLAVYRDGRVLVEKGCQGKKADFLLDAAQLAQLYAWLDTYQRTEYHHSDGAVADGMSVSLVLEGAGQQTASDDVIRAMTDFASRLTMQVK